MELRNTLGRLEEEIWRYRQRGAEQQNSHDTSENHVDQVNLEARASWAKERLSLQLALNQMEQELDQCWADLRADRDRRSGIAGVCREGTGIGSRVCTGSTCGQTVTERPWSTTGSTCSCYWGDSRTVSRPPWL